LSRTSLALVVPALLIGCVVSFDGYRALEETTSAGSAGNPAGGSGRGGSASGGNANAGDGPALGGAAAMGGDGDGGETPIGGGSGGTGGSGGSAGTAGTAGTAGAPAACPVLPGPLLLEIPKQGGGFYCIDRTEVKTSDYAQFLAASPDTADQSADCSWNDSFSPEVSGTCDAVETQENQPVTCIDWCDAKKYCEWTGKELCGAIEGGPINPVDFADPALDAWYSACSADGTREFPYTGAYQSQYCAGLDYGVSSPVAVASLPNCVGGYAGLFDMSGNVSEWENSCDDTLGAADDCLHRGGDLLDADILGGSGRTLRCNSSAAGDSTPSPALARRDTRAELIGVRCCYSPP
jgi:hypothetical protein